MLDDAQMTVVVTGLAIPIGDNWKLREGQCGDNAAMKSRGGNGGKKVVPLRAGPASCATIECSFHRRRHGEW